LSLTQYLCCLTNVRRSYNPFSPRQRVSTIPRFASKVTANRLLPQRRHSGPKESNPARSCPASRPLRRCARKATETGGGDGDGTCRVVPVVIYLPSAGRTQIFEKVNEPEMRLRAVRKLARDRAAAFAPNPPFSALVTRTGRCGGHGHRRRLAVLPYRPPNCSPTATSADGHL